MTTLLTEPESTCPLKAASGLRVAYMMSRFPKLTETFILTEMMAMQEQGVTVEVFPLQRERAKVVHPDAIAFIDHAHFTPWLSLKILIAHVYFLCRCPWVYTKTLFTILKTNYGSRRYFAGAVMFFPKAVFLARLMQRKQIDHLHAHFASHPAMVAWVIHQLTGIPWSFTAHGSDLHRDQHMLVEKVAAAKVAVTISDYNRQFIIDACGPAATEKIRVVHCGVDPEEYHLRDSSTAWDNGTGPLRILCIGTLHEVKGQQYLLQACAQLLTHNNKFECHFVGDGPDREMLETLALELNLNGQVIFHGRHTREEIQDLLPQMDLLVAPSVQTKCGRREGIPVVLMEALASGVPAIGSNLSGIPEILHHEQSGLLTRPGDVDALAAAVLCLAEDADLRHQLALSGRDLVEREFHLHTNTAKLINLFEENDPS